MRGTILFVLTILLSFHASLQGAQRLTQMRAQRDGLTRIIREKMEQDGNFMAEIDFREQKVRELRSTLQLLETMQDVPAAQREGGKKQLREHEQALAELRRRRAQILEELVTFRRERGRLNADIQRLEEEDLERRLAAVRGAERPARPTVPGRAFRPPAPGRQRVPYQVPQPPVPQQAPPAERPAQTAEQL